MMVLAAGRTTEGDLLLTGDNWVGLGADRRRRAGLRRIAFPADPRAAPPRLAR